MCAEREPFAGVLDNMIVANDSPFTLSEKTTFPEIPGTAFSPKSYVVVFPVKSF